MGNLTMRSLTFATNARLLHCYVFSVETWTLTDDLVKDVALPKDAKSTMGRPCQKCESPWKYEEDKEVLTTAKTRRFYLSHFIRRRRRYHLLQSILKGNIPGKTGASSGRISWLINL